MIAEFVKCAMETGNIGEQRDWNLVLTWKILKARILVDLERRQSSCENNLSFSAVGVLRKPKSP